MVCFVTYQVNRQLYETDLVRRKRLRNILVGVSQPGFLFAQTATWEAFIMNIKQTLQRFLAVAEQPKVASKKALSRRDIMLLVARDKLSPTQAEAIIRKRFKGE